MEVELKTEAASTRDREASLLGCVAPRVHINAFSKVDREVGDPVHFPMLWVRDRVGVAWLGKS